MKCVSCGRESDRILCYDCAEKQGPDFYMDRELAGADLIGSIGEESLLVPLAYPAPSIYVRMDIRAEEEIDALIEANDLHQFMKKAGRMLELYGVPLSMSERVHFSGADVRSFTRIVEEIERRVLDGRISGPSSTLVRAGIVFLMAAGSEIYRDLGKELNYPARALRLFEAALLTDPSDDRALEGKLRTLILSERYMDAYLTVKDREKLSPEISVLAGVALSSLGRFREAIRYIDSALKEDIENPDFWRAKCSVLSKMEMYPQARACCMKALELRQDDSETWMLLGDIHTAMGEIDMGIEAYEMARTGTPKTELSRLSPRTAETQNTLQDMDEHSEEPETEPETAADEHIPEIHLPERRTESVIDSLLQDLEPLNPAPLMDRAEHLLDEGKYDEALDIYEQQIEMNPDDVRALLGKARALLGKKQLDRAFRILDRVAEIEPDNPWPWYYKGVAMKDLGRWGGAVQLLATATSIRPDFIPAHLERARILTERGRLEDALRIYNSVLKMENICEAHTGKGNVLMTMGKWGAALQEALTALKIEPGNLDALLLKARIEKDRGLWERLLDTAEEIITGHPEMAEGYLYRGEALRGLERFEEAAEALGEAVKRDGTNAKAWLLLGETLSAMQEVDKALKIYDRALMISREKELVWLARARALYSSGREKEGAEALRKAMELNPDSPEVKEFVMELNKGGEE